MSIKRRRAHPPFHRRKNIPMTTTNYYTKAREAVSKPFRYTVNIHSYCYQVLPLLIVLSVVACCAYAIVLAVVYMPLSHALVAVPTLGAVVGGCGWCAWAFVEKGEEVVKVVKEQRFDVGREIRVIGRPLMGLREVVVVAG